MPTAVLSTTSKPGKAIDKSLVHSHARKARTARRRGRVPNGIESEDEIERAATTDSETGDDRSSLESDSDIDSVSDDTRPNGRPEVVTPSTTQSPSPLEIDGRDSLTNGVPPKLNAVPPATGPFVSPTDWAEMVSAEYANGAEDLPVIDFADLDSHQIDQPVASTTRSRKPQRPSKKHAAKRSTSAPPASPPVAFNQREEARIDSAAEEPVASTSGHIIMDKELYPSRLRGQSARQAYQQRLETDPSFVPRVGEFWGHDDRLLDKDLRSLSGWWRGRWQSRGRARGMRGRGRGFLGGRLNPFHEQSQNGNDESGAAAPALEVPPIEQPWTHDGFEEMKRRDERYREQKQQSRAHQQQQQGQSQEQQEQSQQPPPQQQVRFGAQRGFGFRGRGAFFNARGRGGFARGGFMSPTGSRQGFHFNALAGRPWFAMKPERMWTKQHDAFLYFDPMLKPRLGQGPGFRVKLPGGREQVIRAPPRSFPSLTESVVTRTVCTPDDGEKIFTVRIPPRAGKERTVDEMPPAPEVQSVAVEEPATTAAELSIEEVFTVRPHIVPNRRIDLHIPPKLPAVESPAPASLPGSTGPRILSQPPSPASSSKVANENTLRQHANSLSLDRPSVTPVDTSPSAEIKESLLRHPSTYENSIPVQSAPSVEGPRPTPPVLPPLQTTFSPIPPTSPPYGSPYAYGTPLPPGIAMSQHGPYEIATGRPVYLQPTPPPMFTPRPMMHTHMAHPSMSAPFVSAHVHHHSHSTASPDFLSHPYTHPHTPPVGTFVDPSTGVPIFAPARQSSRIEIRVPGDADVKRPSGRPSHLRSSLSSSGGYAAADVAQSSSDIVDATSSSSDAPTADQPQVQAQAADPAMAYQPYQQQYYYPEHYGYPSYMDMSPSVMHYEMYPQDHRGAQPMIYY
ncbi:hypothetical protein AcW1_004901 [Taiwanofungus camphoratus]|nr:hypothetical protein AcV5_001288 [Antrodia cinnamomea]KAI0960372.1 hypothetical protein AcW1_004901 [Antrodia cinnamomea]